MNTAEVVMNSIERHGMTQVVHLLAEAVGQPGESAHTHAHGEVRALHVACGNVPTIRVARNGLLRSLPKQTAGL